MQTVQGKAMIKEQGSWTDEDPDIGTKRTSQEDKISVGNLGRE